MANKFDVSNSTREQWNVIVQGISKLATRVIDDNDMFLTRTKVIDYSATREPGTFPLQGYS